MKYSDETKDELLWMNQKKTWPPQDQSWFYCTFPWFRGEGTYHAIDVSTAPRQARTAPRRVRTAPRQIRTAPHQIRTAPRQIRTKSAPARSSRTNEISSKLPYFAVWFPSRGVPHAQWRHSALEASHKANQLSPGRQPSKVRLG